MKIILQPSSQRWPLLRWRPSSPTAQSQARAAQMRCGLRGASVPDPRRLVSRSTSCKGNQGAVGKIAPRTQKELLFLSLCAKSKSCYSFGFWTQRDVGSLLLCLSSARWVSQMQPQLAVGQNRAAGAEGTPEQ